MPLLILSLIITPARAQEMEFAWGGLGAHFDPAQSMHAHAVTDSLGSVTITGEDAKASLAYPVRIGKDRREHPPIFNAWSIMVQDPDGAHDGASVTMALLVNGADPDLPQTHILFRSNDHASTDQQSFTEALPADVIWDFSKPVRIVVEMKKTPGTPSPRLWSVGLQE